MNDVDGAFVAVRAASFIATLQAAGVALFVALPGRRLEPSAQVIRRLGIWSALAGVLLVVAQYGLEAPRITGDLAGLWNRALQLQLLQSSTAAAGAMRLIALVMLATGLRHSGTSWLAVAGALLLPAAFTLTGHTTTHSPRWLLAALLWSHLLIVAFWFGSLPALLLVSRLEAVATVARVVAAFTALAGWLVPCIALAGIGMAVMLLPDPGALRQPYGLLLLVKLGTFVTLMGLAALNKWRLAPRLASDAQSVEGLRASITAEYVLIVGVLIVSALLTTFYSPEP